MHGLQLEDTYENHLRVIRPSSINIVYKIKIFNSHFFYSNIHLKLRKMFLRSKRESNPKSSQPCMVRRSNHVFPSLP